MNCKYIKPENIEEVLTLTSKHANFMFVAGGTDVFVNRQQGNSTADLLIDITSIKELNKIEVNKDIIEIGSMVTLNELINNKFISGKFSALKDAALSVASPVIRKSATIGGNLLCENRCIFYNQSEWWRKAVGFCLKCNGDVCIATGGKKNCFSKFVSDTAPALIAYNAFITIVDEKGERIIPLEKLYSGDGVNPVIKDRHSLLKNIIIPVQKNYRAVFNKLRPRKSMDFTSLTTVVSIDEEDNIRIVIGGVDPMPVLITGTKKDNLSQLVTASVKKPRIVDNDFYPRKYRKEMINYFVSSSLKQLEEN